MTSVRKVALFSKEYPPHVYGGAGVHVEYLARALARSVDVEVRCFGEQHADEGRLGVRGYPQWWLSSPAGWGSLGFPSF